MGDLYIKECWTPLGLYWSLPVPLDIANVCFITLNAQELLGLYTFISWCYFVELTHGSFYSDPLSRHNLVLVADMHIGSLPFLVSTQLHSFTFYLWVYWWSGFLIGSYYLVIFILVQFIYVLIGKLNPFKFSCFDK